MVTRRRSPQSVLSTASRPGSSVLVVEDEQDVADLLRYNLAKEGYDVVIVGNGADALKRARETKPELILLDIMVPQLNGWEVCRRLKQDAETRGIPIIMVTGRVEEGDKVLGFEMGADDYVTKPFSPREIVARVRAVLRRAQPRDAAPSSMGTSAAGSSGMPLPAPPAASKPMGQALLVEEETRRAFVWGNEVELTRVEFDLLTCLLGAPGRVFTRVQLIDRVWGGGFAITDRTIDSHVKSLRRKVSDAGGQPALIETVRGVGYRVNERPAQPPGAK